MEIPKALRQIIKKCNAGARYKETNYFLQLIAIATFLVLFFFAPPVFYLELSPNIYGIFGALIILLFGIVFLVGIIYDEIRKVHSIRVIKVIISDLKKGEWSWKEKGLLPHILRLHPTAIGHESIVYLIGHFVLREGYEKDGIFLINRAKEKDPKLGEINMSNNLSVAGARYLYDSLVSIEDFKRAYIIRQLWNKRVIRYSILVVFVLIILFQTFVQIARNLN